MRRVPLLDMLLFAYGKGWLAQKAGCAEGLQVADPSGLGLDGPQPLQFVERNPIEDAIRGVERRFAYRLSVHVSLLTARD